MADIARAPMYREGMKRELVRFIKATDPAESPAVLAAACYGAICEAAGMGARSEPALTSALARALGEPVPKTTIAVA